MCTYLGIIECTTHNSIAKWNLKGHTGHQMQFLKVCVYKGMRISRASQFVSWICPLGFIFQFEKLNKSYCRTEEVGQLHSGHSEAKLSMR